MKVSPLTSVAATRAVLEAHELTTKKVFGQHFLINDGIVSRICELAALSPDETVLEVGPGIGTLTLALLQKTAAVVAVEYDEDLMAVLADTCALYQERFALIGKDALTLSEIDITESLTRLQEKALLQKSFSQDVPFPQKLVSNLPYAVAATLILDYFVRFPQLRSATVMVQREVADRIEAHPGTKAYGAYTVKLSLYAHVEGGFTVAPQNFYPPPRVESAVIRLNREEIHDEQGVPLKQETREAACLMADAAFAHRRKTILNSAKMFFSLRSEEGQHIAVHLLDIFEEAAIDPSIRGEMLERDDFVRLGKALKRYRSGVHVS